MCVFVYYALMHAFLMLLLEKLNITAILQKIATYLKCKQLHELSECDFCKNFWFGLILTIPASLFFGADWLMLAYSAMSTPIVIVLQRNVYK